MKKTTAAQGLCANTKEWIESYVRTDALMDGIKTATVGAECLCVSPNTVNSCVTV